MPVIAQPTAQAVAAALIAPIGLLAGGITAASAAPARPAHPGPRLFVRQILAGGHLTHRFIPVSSATAKTELLTQPDDLAILDGRLFTGFQNGVGPQGEPSTDGNRDSTIVEFTLGGRVIRQWDVRGKVDGLGAQPDRRRVIATVNEDAHSSVYTITPGAPAGSRVQHYRYNVPLPHRGGTDAVSTYHGRVLISASAPGTSGPAAPQPGYPAVYAVTFGRASHIATVRPVFFDEAAARLANAGPGRGKVVRLGLTDPDSNEVVPHSAARFGGAFMLTSQADQEQIFLRSLRHRRAGLTVLKLSQAVDDTAWATRRWGLLYATDATTDTVDVAIGRFHVGSVFVAVTPCDAGHAPSACPAPPAFPANYLGSLNPWTGHITRVALHGPALDPKGLIFVGLG